MIWVSLALAGIQYEKPPTLAEAVVVTVMHKDRPARGETVRVVHLPGTAHENERAIGITDARGRATWTPETAGVYELRAGKLTHRGRVPYPSAPPETAVLFAALFITALASLLWGLRRQRRTV